MENPWFPGQEFFTVKTHTHTQCIRKPIGGLKAKQKVVIKVSSAQEKSYSSFSIINTFHKVVRGKTEIE